MLVALMVCVVRAVIGSVVRIDLATVVVGVFVSSLWCLFCRVFVSATLLPKKIIF